MSGVRVRVKNRILRKLGVERYQDSENDQFAFQCAAFARMEARARRVAAGLKAYGAAVRAQRDAARVLALAFSDFYASDDGSMSGPSGGSPRTQHVSVASPLASAGPFQAALSQSPQRICEKMLQVADGANAGEVNGLTDTLEYDVLAPLEKWLSEVPAP